MQISGNGLQLNLENLLKADSGAAEKILNALKSENSGNQQSLALMEPGTYFRGKVLEIIGNKAVIGMESGEQFLAKIENSISLEPKANLLFEIKNNEKGTVLVKPVLIEQESDVIAAKALSAAKMSATGKNVEIVRNLLEEKMPVDKGNIQKILRDTIQNPDVPVKVLVQMEKAGLAVTPENIDQFVAYQEGQNRIETQIEELTDDFWNGMEQLAEWGQGKEVVNANKKVLEFLLSEQGKELPLSTEQKEQLNLWKDVFKALEQGLEGKMPGQDNVPEKENLEQPGELKTDNNLPLKESIPGEKQNKTSGKSLLFPESAAGTKEELKNTGLFEGAKTTVITGREKQQILEPEVLTEKEETSLRQPIQPDKIMEQLTGKEKPVLDVLHEIIKKSDYKECVKRALKEQNFLLPEEVGDKEKVKDLYQRMQNEIRILREAVEQLPGRELSGGKQMANPEGNLDFMQQLNQVYSYIQLPLKMSGENAHGDLYVFADKKRLKQDKEELSALLHLDMEKLGAMDIFVTLNGKKVGTKMTLEKEEILELFAAHIDQLTERLEQKGYQVSTTLETGKAEPDFVQDFLLKGEAVKEGVQHFSFDVKA